MRGAKLILPPFTQNKNVMVLKGFFVEIVFRDLDSGDFQFFSFYTPSGEILGLPLLNQSTIDS